MYVYVTRLIAKQGRGYYDINCVFCDYLPTFSTLTNFPLLTSYNYQQTRPSPKKKYENITVPPNFCNYVLDHLLSYLATDLNEIVHVHEKKKDANVHFSFM